MDAKTKDPPMTPDATYHLVNFLAACSPADRGFLLDAVSMHLETFEEGNEPPGYVFLAEVVIRAAISLGPEQIRRGDPTF